MNVPSESLVLPQCTISPEQPACAHNSGQSFEASDVVFAGRDLVTKHRVGDLAWCPLHDLAAREPLFDVVTKFDDPIDVASLGAGNIEHRLSFAFP